jgi:hypothetical protein
MKREQDKIPKGSFLFVEYETMETYKMINIKSSEEDTRDRDRWRNLVLGEGKPL